MTSPGGQWSSDLTLTLSSLPCPTHVDPFVSYVPAGAVQAGPMPSVPDRTPTTRVAGTLLKSGPQRGLPGWTRLHPKLPSGRHRDGSDGEGVREYPVWT